MGSGCDWALVAIAALSPVVFECSLFAALLFWAPLKRKALAINSWFENAEALW